MTAIDRNGVTISIAAADTDGSALVSGDEIKGEITSWGNAGGNQDVENVAAFGGFINKIKAREQFEITMEVTPKIDSDASVTDRWDIFKYGATQTSLGTGSLFAIFIENANGSNFKTFASNNAQLVSWEPSHSADDNMVGTATWKISPETDLGADNVRTSAVAASDAFFTW